MSDRVWPSYVEISEKRVPEGSKIEVTVSFAGEVEELKALRHRRRMEDREAEEETDLKAFRARAVPVGAADTVVRKDTMDEERRGRVLRMMPSVRVFYIFF